MKYYFLDASALVYAYAPGCESIRALVLASARGVSEVRVVVCDFALPECVYALIERQLAGDIPVQRLATAVQRIEADFGPSPAFIIVEASGVMQHGVELMRLYKISAPGSVTVAAALAARTSVPLDWEFCFVSEDEEQTHAAQAEGFEVCKPHELPEHPAG